MRIIQEVATQKSLTSTQICQIIREVPRTTIYRHITLLLEYNLLSIISEKKIRGSIERTLAINLGEFQKLNTIENASQNALGFLLEKYGQFHTYFTGENPKTSNGKIFLNNTILMLDDSEFDHFLTDLRDLLLRYTFESNQERKIRDISIISAPVDEYERK